MCVVKICAVVILVGVLVVGEGGRREMDGWRRDMMREEGEGGRWGWGE